MLTYYHNTLLRYFIINIKTGKIHLIVVTYFLAFFTKNLIYIYINNNSNDNHILKYQLRLPEP
jgi:hypothetical protein